MQKGQSSIDMIFAIMVAIAFFSVLALHNDNLTAQVNEVSLKNGLQPILLDVYTATASAKAYDLNILYASPKLKIGQSATPLNCTILFIDNVGTSDDINVVSAGASDSYRGIRLDGIKLNGTALSGTRTFSCGEKFTIEK